MNRTEQEQKRLNDAALVDKLKRAAEIIALSTEDTHE